MEAQIKINGEVVTEEQLQEKKNDNSIRLIKEGDNSYRVLTRMVE
jgi:hypothetical protein